MHLALQEKRLYLTNNMQMLTTKNSLESPHRSPAYLLSTYKTHRDLKKILKSLMHYILDYANLLKDSYRIDVCFFFLDDICKELVQLSSVNVNLIRPFN